MGSYLIGTSGYSYDDWRGVFYPADLPKNKMFDYYTRFYKAVEINSTYYRLPGIQSFERLSQKAPEGFEFVVKAHQTVTHLRENPEESLNRLLLLTEPMKEKAQLGGILLQFPYSFKNTPGNRDYLKKLRDICGDVALFVEFRNISWLREEVYELLKMHQLGYVNVDQPRLKGLLPPQSQVTSHLGYVRFHGRNETNWWQGSNLERYDYEYTPQQLEEWLIRIADILKKSFRTYIFFNNHPRGQAISDSKKLENLLNSYLPHH
ncbi:MAG: DUF72 domain-containing protein [Calditrichia bacterium]